MKRSIMTNILSAAFAVAAIATSVAPAFAQAASGDASPLPRYYDATGARVWGSWGPATANQQTTQPLRRLYMSARPRGSHVRVR